MEVIEIREKRLSRTVLADDGAEIRWEQSPGRMPLLLVPGLGGDSTCWGNVFLMKLRASGISLVTYDPRGLGDSSSGSDSPSLALFAEDAASVAAAAGERCAVLGWSMGVSVALELALAHPERVVCLVLCCGTSDHGELVRRRPELFRPVVDCRVPIETLAEYMADLLCPASSGSGPEQIKMFSAAVRRSFERSSEGIRAQQNVLKAIRPFGERLRRIDIPVLVISGSDDQLVPAEEGRALARVIPGARFELWPGGHGLLYEYPGELAGHIAEYLESCSGDAASR